MTSESLRSDRERLLVPTVITALGVVLVGIEIRHLAAMDTLEGTLLEAALPLLLAIVLTLAGVWLGRSDVDRDGMVRMIGWVVLGTVVMATVTAWVVGHQLIRGSEFHHTTFVFANTMIVGAIGGFVVGVYDLRSTRRLADLTREREKLARGRERMLFLNQLLRHNVLNEMNVSLGRAGTLGPHVAAAGMDDLRAITRSNEDVVALVQKVRLLTDVACSADGADLEPVDLSAVLANEIEGLRLRHPAVEVTTAVPDAVHVAADDLLSVVFENLLRNSVVHNDGERPRVHVAAALVDDGERVLVTVADDGPGIPEDRKAALFEPDGVDPSSDGHGVGLLIVDALVSRYGGTVAVSDRDGDAIPGGPSAADPGTGSVFTVELRRVESPDRESSPTRGAAPKATPGPSGF